MTRSKFAGYLTPIDLPTEREGPFDPAGELGELRTNQPMCPLRYPDGHVGWLASGYELARAILGDPRFSMRPTRFPVGDGDQHLQLAEETHREFPEAGDGVLLVADPPDHVRLRRLQASDFTVGGVSRYRAQIERIVDERIDALEEAGSPVDFIAEFAKPVASLALCALLGVPKEDRKRFEPATNTAGLDFDADERIETMRDLSAYIKGVIERKREQPADDVISKLIQTGEMTDAEIVGAAALLFDAGHDTTATMFGFGLFALLDDRSQWEYLHSNPEGIDNAVEELLRYLTIFHLGAFGRTATEDLEIEEAEVRAGETVTVSLAAANRDPRKYPDPDALDLCRDPRGHLAFGYGRHICLGQHFARLQLRIAFEALLRRLPSLKLAVPSDEVSMVSSHSSILYGVERLLVEWD